MADDIPEIPMPLVRTPASPRRLKTRSLRDPEGRDVSEPSSPSSRTPNLIVDQIIGSSVDTMLVYMCADTLAKGFQDEGITKVLTVETAGISIAFPLAMCLGVNMVYARKKRIMCERPMETSYRRKGAVSEGRLCVAGEFFKPGDRVLVCDSFLATGHTIEALIRLTRLCKAEVVGCVVMIEKVWKHGRAALAAAGVERVGSLLRIQSMDTTSGIVFDDEQESNMAADMLRASIIERAAVSEGWGVD
eukprot:c7083_g1_i2.p2 GENE.c7083_g1_i2~~c7083_g1_i2.p2  ORF type:complete len:259 (+),score=50.93 c7083_g1_i2:37-777(+)